MTERVYIIDGEEYDPDALTVGFLRGHGLDPLAGIAPLQLIGLLLATKYTDDETVEILNRAPSVTERVTVEGAVTFVSEPDGDTD